MCGGLDREGAYSNFGPKGRGFVREGAYNEGA